MEKVGQRIASAVVAVVIGIIICFALLYWLDSPPMTMFVVIPIACAIAGFVAGDKAIEVLKHIAEWI